jgi:hypothetical protein
MGLMKRKTQAIEPDHVSLVCNNECTVNVILTFCAAMTPVMARRLADQLMIHASIVEAAEYRRKADQPDPPPARPPRRGRR